MRSLSDAVPGDQKEFRYLELFCNRTIPQVAGFFKSDIWHRLLVQMILREPAVRHAAVSLASLHEQFGVAGSVSTRYEDSVRDEFALQQYNQAINHLIKPISTQGKQAADVYLISCLLFACIEVGSAPIHTLFQSNPNPMLSFPNTLDSPRTSWRRHLAYQEWGQYTVSISVACRTPTVSR